jgi:hypothetical protein
MPTAEEIFEGEKHQDKIWLMMKQIFEILAMHDVRILIPTIIQWINNSLSFFPNRMPVRSKLPELYLDFLTGINLACILYIYTPSGPN